MGMVRGCGMNQTSGNQPPLCQTGRCSSDLVGSLKVLVRCMRFWGRWSFILFCTASAPEHIQNDDRGLGFTLPSFY